MEGIESKEEQESKNKKKDIYLEVINSDKIEGQLIKKRFTGLTEDALEGRLDGWLSNATESLGKTLDIKNVTVNLVVKKKGSVQLLCPRLYFCRELF